MTPSTEFDLQAEWAKERCPLIDGIVFGDGRVRRISTQWVFGTRGEVSLQYPPNWETTLHQLSNQGMLDWADITARCEATDVAMNLRVVAGEGAMGGEGFVTLLKNSGETPIWIAFFQESNPFLTVRLDSGHVLAKSNHGIWWRFPIERPYDITFE